MIEASEYLSAAHARGFDFYTGVPCSFLTPLINRVIGDPSAEYVGAASEGEAVAIAAGAWLAGRGTTVMCQNSGLGNAVNPLTSLNHPFRIPSLLIVTWRGQPGLKDEPQHRLMGEITPSLLDVVRISHLGFPKERDEIEPALAAADGEMGLTGLPFAFVMDKGAVREEGLSQPEAVVRARGERIDLTSGAPRPSRVQVLERFLARAPGEAAVIATTGRCGRELFTLADRPQHLYQVGSMGCASAMALGVALNVDRPVVVLDGDGAALMRMGNMATIGARAPRNLIHVILDNGAHDSTGGQQTVSPNVDFAGAAVACGYARAAVCDDLAGFEEALAAALRTPGPHLVHVRIRPGSIAALGRPTVAPREVATRFRAFLAGGPGPEGGTRETGASVGPQAGLARPGGAVAP
jgi:phosphonopyruvate decarboxylase